MPVPTGSSSNNPWKISDVGTVVTGPQIGSQTLFSFGPVSPAAGSTDLVVVAFQAPCDMRLERLSWSCNASTGTGCTIKFAKHATAPQLSGSTNLLSATSADLDANNSDFVAPSGETAGANTATLNTTAGVRDIAKGVFVIATVTTDASTGAVPNLCVLFAVVINGFSNVNGSSN